MGFFSRIFNLISGLLNGKVAKAEAENPEAVYQQSIDLLMSRYAGFRKAAAALVARRSELETKVERLKKLLNQNNQDLEAAVDGGQDDLAITLIQKQSTLQSDLEETESEAVAAVNETTEAKASLTLIKQEIERLKGEMGLMVSRYKSAQAKLQIQGTLDGMSVEADAKALDAVRANINNLIAQTKLNAELHDSDIDNRLAKLRQNSAPAAAKAKLEELKLIRAAQRSDAANNKQQLTELLENTKKKHHQVEEAAVVGAKR